MKCIFGDMLCVRGGDSHDDCRRCRKVPEMKPHSDLENRYLCAIGGMREKETKYYGSPSSGTPAWLKSIIKKNRGMGDYIPHTDHRRYLRPLLVINEPYNAHMEDMRNLIKFCDDNGLSFRIDGESAHFPGRCFRILITKKTDQKPVIQKEALK